MGIDVGSRRIGVAFSDVEGRVATAHSTIEAAPRDEAVDQLVDLVEERSVERVVFGWPVRMDGTEGRATEAVEAFVEAFEGRCEERGVDVGLDRWDERLSSKEAESVLIDADLSRERRRGVVDRVAAARILQTYLDAPIGES
jgi:putative Holliday junction resolvase